MGDLDIGDALATFSARYPRLKIELVLGELMREHGATEATFDLILKTRSRPNAAAQAKRIARLNYITCASPDYLARMGAGRIRRRILATHRCLVHAEETVWRYSQRGRTRRITVAAAFSSNSFEVLAKAAIQGLGIALLPQRLVRQELEAQMLAPILPQWHAPAHSLYGDLQYAWRQRRPGARAASPRIPEQSKFQARSRG